MHESTQSSLSSRRSFAAAIAAASAGVASGNVTAQDATPSSPGVEKTRQVIDSYVDALLTGGDFGQYLAEDVLFEMLDVGVSMSGRQTAVDLIVDFHTVAFDAQPEVVNTIVSARAAALEIVFRGTHTGDFNGIPATGMDVEVPYSAFYDVEDGMITAFRLYGPSLGLMQQLGMSATPVGAAVQDGIVHVELYEFGIDAESTSFTVGQQYTFVATNVGDMVHELVIEPAGALDEPLEKDDVESEVEDINPGTEAELVWTFGEAGAFQFACHIEGHYEAGMVLEFEVVS